MANISPFLMFNKNAKEAVDFYISVFPNSEILDTIYFTGGEIDELKRRLPADQIPANPGDVKMITARINGLIINAGNGGSYFEFNHGVSMFVRCESQQQIDQIWDKLSKDGEIEECGWIKDKYGVPWQVTPAILDKWQQDPDKNKLDRLGVQILRSKKLIIEELRRAYEGK